MSCCIDTNQKGSERKMKNQEKKNQKKKEATKEAKAKTPKVKEYLGDQSSSKECPNCHKVLPLTTQYWWIYRDLRKGPKIEDNIYYPHCRECYTKYRKRLSKKAKKTSKSSKEPVASKKQSPKKKESKPAGETKGKAPKANLDHSPFFLVNLKDEVSQVIPITKNHYIVKKVDTNDRLL